MTDFLFPPSLVVSFLKIFLISPDLNHSKRDLGKYQERLPMTSDLKSVLQSTLTFMSYIMLNKEGLT